MPRAFAFAADRQTAGIAAAGGVAGGVTGGVTGGVVGCGKRGSVFGVAGVGGGRVGVVGAV